MSLAPRDGHPVLLDARRHDGEPHMRWSGKLVASTDRLIAVSSAPGTPVEHWTRELRYSLDHWCLAVFPAGADYNLMIDFTRSGQLVRTYVNLASAAAIEADVISWTDLWVDVVFVPGHAPEILDTDELTTATTLGLVSEASADQVLRIARRIAASDAAILRPPSLHECLDLLAVGAVPVP
jgi:predicted RNA-binding protein associated with RNAse of E/G family